MDQRTNVSAAALKNLAADIFVKLGMKPADADLVADVHVDAEGRGEESHGIRLLFPHFERIKAGAIRPGAEPELIRDRGATAILDAKHGIGQVAAVRAMTLAVEKAAAHGIGAVGVINANSFTSAKYYPLIAARRGMIGIAYTNSRPMMPPPGGKAAKIGNNPFSIAAPADSGPPFVLDMACTIAREKIWLAKAEGTAIPEGWALGPDGESTTDPNQALDGGVLLPFGGHKAFGIGMAHEVLTSVLCGGELATGEGTGFRPYENLYRASHLFQAIDIECFSPLNDFQGRMSNLLSHVRASPCREGVERIFTPGEHSSERLQIALEHGVEVRSDVLATLLDYADKLSAEVPAELKRSDAESAGRRNRG